MRDQEKQYSLIACLLAQASAKDNIVETFSLCLHSAEKEAQRQYAGSNQKRNGLMEDIIKFALDAATGYKKIDQKKLDDYLKKSYQHYGGIDKLIDDCKNQYQIFVEKN